MTIKQQEFLLSAVPTVPTDRLSSSGTAPYQPSPMGAGTQGDISEPNSELNLPFPVDKQRAFPLG